MPAIVFMASDSSYVAALGMTVYGASKAALVMLARGISVDHPRVRVNCVCPSIVDTPMSRRDMGRVHHGFGGADYPVHSADDVARYALFLASPASRSVNGTSLVADFGYMARSAFPA